jgi:hypothetical protein
MVTDISSLQDSTLEEEEEATANLRRADATTM